MRDIVNARFVRDGAVPLARRSPHRNTYAGLRSFTGGHVEPGETLTEALVREVHEEGGITPTAFAFLRATIDPDTAEDDPATYMTILFQQREPRCRARGVGMAEITKLAKRQRSRNKAVKRATKPLRLQKREKGRKWPSFAIRAISMPLVTELLRDTAPPMSPGANAILESGVLAFRRENDGEPLVLLISKRRSKKWGIPKGRAEPHLSLPENAAKEAFEEAGVVGYISSSSVGMFRATKSTATVLREQVIEVWVYLLEVTETLPDWPEKGRRTIRWVSCEAAAQQLREPVLTHLCHRLAQS